MADEDNSFNYADLNLDFLELSPPRNKIIQKPVTAATYTPALRANSYKAKDLAQRVAQSDVLIRKIELLKSENTDVQQKLRDFQKSANQIQKLYENEKNKCMDLQAQFKAVEIKAIDLQEHCTRLDNEVAEKQMQLEQLEAQLDNSKGPLTFTELAIKYLKLVQKLNEDDTIKLYDKTLLDDLSTYCEERGKKVPVIKVKANKKRKYKKDKDIQCTLLDDADKFVSKQVHTQSTQTSVIQTNQMQTQTIAPSIGDMQTQTSQTETNSTKSTQNQAVQTRSFEVRTQGTQHISTTTTRGTSTSCFIKKHNVGTIFPEPKLIPPEAALVDKFFELWSVSPLSPISDPISEIPFNESELSISTPVAPLPDTSKSIGTCTYLCNVQRQIDYMPIMEPIKRSQSNSPSPFIYDNVKFEVNATPAPSPPPAAPLSTRQLHENVETARVPTNNISNLQPMLSALTELPEIHPDVFSTVWQMAGQMFMGLLYSPTSNHLRAQQFIRSGDSHNLQQFQNWVQSLYESRQMPQQQTPSTLQTQCNQQINRRESTFDSNTVINANVTQSTDVSTQSEDVAREEIPCGGSSNTMTDLSSNNNGTDGSTQTQNECGSFEQWIFKEPLELPKRSVKQARGQKMFTEEPICSRKRKDNRKRKKRNKAKKAKLLSASIFSEYPDSKAADEEVTVNESEQNCVTAVEFCANLCSFNQDLPIENVQNVPSESVFSAQLQNVCFKEPVNIEQTDDEKLNNTTKDLDISTKNKRVNALSSNDNHLPSLQDKNSENMVMVQPIKVPDVTLSESDRIECDNLENVESRGLTENLPKIFDNQIKQKSDFAYKIFGSDSDEDDSDVENTKFCTKSEKIFITNDVISEITEYYDKSEEIIHCKESLEDNMLHEMSESTHNQCNLKENDVESISAKLSESFQQLNTEADFTKIHKEIHKLELPIIPPSKKSELTKGTEDPEIADSSVCEFSMTHSVFQNKEAISLKSKTSLEPVCNSHSENEECDEPQLVIVESDTEKMIKTRTNSESSATFDDSISQICSKDTFQPTSSDSDISAIFEGSIADDLLENASTKQLVNSILSESANEQKGTDVTVPRKRGRKRKCEMPAVTFCKRSARLRNKQMRDNQFSSVESLSTKKDSNNQQKFSDQSNNDACNDKKNLSTITELRQAKDKIVHSLSKEHISDQFQLYVEMKQRANNVEENYDDQSISELQVSTSNTFADTNVVADTSNAVINKQNSTFFRPFEEFVTEAPTVCYPGPSVSLQQNVTSGGTLESTLASSSQPSNDINNSALTSTINQIDLETPASPPPATFNENALTHTQIVPEIPLDMNTNYCPSNLRKSMLHNVMNKYSFDSYATITGKRKRNIVETKITAQIKEFLDKTRDQVDITASRLAASLQEQSEDCEILASVIIDQICNAPRPEIELNCELAQVPPKYIGTHLRLTSILLRHLKQNRPKIIDAVLRCIENKLFSYQRNETFSLNFALNLTQLYLVVIPLHNAEHNPARLFIAKCLYYHNVMASPMIYEVLCWYPTTLPHRDESTYDKSDALITVIQHLLMSTTYNMDSKDLRHRELLSLLRFEYHFEPFKPKALEVLSDLVAKLESGNLTNLIYAFAIFCKRNTKLVDILLQQQLLPLTDEYYKLVQHTNEYDERIACLLDCISAVVKPLPLTTNVSAYLSLFERFLGVVQRPVVQEAAVLAILRLQRFGQNRCFHALAHFKPHYPLQMITTNALKTFIHRKPLKYWNGLMRTISN
ncbi:little elongation complex subunit 1 [Zeugodacus cucurbitae]|uniref:little elongation complex subunit 1 n=1 Tax=Zeugodacus cucurbitae TaxID=28588 RepID=UPI0005968959|nr:little elongation complex subunit 1 [Zeugodacus cucurbitae]